MYCRFCGKEIPEGARFCINCGKEVDVAETYSPVNPAVVVNPAQNYHLAWFKFIIYFQLFAIAAVMTCNAVTCLFGLAYGDDAGLIYGICPPLKAIDMIYGIICLGVAVTAIFVRQRMAHYREKAPVLYMGFIGVVMALGLLYNFAVLAALGTVSSSVMESGAANVAGTVLGTVIGAVVYFPLNYIYFKKRKELFVN